MTTIANWNGKDEALADLKIPVEDRGFFFGDGVYEAIKVYSGRAFLAAEHFARLGRSLNRVSLSCDVAALAARTERNIAVNAIDDGVVYVQVTRGTAPRLHSFPGPGVETNTLIYTKPSADPYRDRRPQGVAAITAEDSRWKYRDIKSINLLPNCLAAEAARARGADEAIFIADDLRVNEGTSSNVFIVTDGVLRTPPADHHILGGITRQFVLGLAQTHGVPTREEVITAADLARADEVLITSTTKEILPVVTVDGSPVGSGRPGPVAKTLLAAFAAAVETFRRDGGKSVMKANEKGR